MKTTETLYQLTDELLALDDLLEDTEGEVTPEIEQWLEEYGLKSRTKVDNMCRYEAELRARAAAKKAEAKRLSDRARKEDADADRVKRLFELAMHRLGTRRLEGDHFTVAVQKNGGKRAFQVAQSAEQLPEAYRRTETRYVALTEELRQRAEEAIPEGYEGHVYLYRDEGELRQHQVVAEIEVDPARIPIAVLQPRGESVRIR